MMHNVGLKKLTALLSSKCG